MPFRDRIDAGRRLAASLVRYRNEQPVVLALPRGGVIVAGEIAAALSAPLELVLVRKIGVPQHPELAMGAVVDGARPVVVRNEDVIRAARVGQAAFDAVCAEEMAEIERRRSLYLGKRRPLGVADCTAIVVDDGIATGATVRAALQAIRLQGPRKTILAIPVAPDESLEEVRTEADEILCLESYALFGSVGTYYSDFRQISDQQVIDTLHRFAQPSTVDRFSGGESGKLRSAWGR
jgi:predicted phosphoribosyltransferase